MYEENARNSQVISKKNDQIDLMRVKLNRYEFALKEAVLFLGKPMETYNNWLQTGSTIVHASSGAGGGSSAERSRNVSAPVTQSYALSRKGTTGSNQQSIPEDESTTTATPTSKASSTVIKNEDIPNLECIRLALNYLKNAQTSIQNMKTPTASSEDLKKVDQGLLINSTTSSPTGPVMEESLYLQNIPVITSPRRPELTLLHHQDSVVDPSSITAENVDNLQSTSILENVQLSSPDLSTSCEKCKNLKENLVRSRNEVSLLKSEVLTLKSHLEEEQGARERIQLSKDILDQELEELTAQLFDQANKMVIDEARMRDQLENANHELQSEWKKLLKKFENREGELNDLKRCLVALDAVKQKSANMSSSPYSSHSNISNGLAIINGSPQLQNNVSEAVKLHQTGKSSFLSSRIGPNNSLIPFIPMDGILSSEFQDHIKSINSTANQPLSQALNVLMSTLFMKRCMLEDVEPCLLYSYQSNGASFKNGAPVTNAFRKRVFDAVLRGACEVSIYWSSKENLYLGTHDSTDSTSSPSSVGSVNSSSPSSKSPSLNATAPTPNTSSDISPPKKKCCGCGLTRECDYRLRFTNLDRPANTAPSYSEWFPICRFCRDRVTCVNDFFSYMAHLRQGVIGKGVSILAMFKHTMWLRRRMSVARLGGCAVLEGDIMGDWEKLVKIIY